MINHSVIHAPGSPPTSRSQRAVINILSTLLLQVFTLVSGLIVPRIILGTFGSGVNGVVSSITQFLSYIVLLESGVGGVIKAALYKPLAEKNINQLSGILTATQDFFRKIAVIFIGYMLILTLIFPLVTSSTFDWGYTASLIVIIGISTAVQYYFGLTYQLLLQSDQKLYIINTIRILSIVLNAILVVILTVLNLSIHWVKFGSSLAFILRPLLISHYVNRHYALNKAAPPDKNAIRQRWDGFGQHIAFFIHNNTDVAVLSVFSSMLEVSVYTVHYSIVYGIKTLLSALSTGCAPAMGDMIARKEMSTLNRTVNAFEGVCFILVSIFFTITALMIEPFIMLYTRGISDINYFRPVFAYFLCAAEAIYVIRDIYSTVVLSAGHYKQTSRGAYLEAAINIVFSVLLVHRFGLVGVAVGTCIAMSYRTLSYVVYLSGHILHRPPSLFLKRLLVNLGGVLLSCLLVYSLLPRDIQTWMAWIIHSCMTGIIVTCCVSLLNYVFYRQEFCAGLRRIKQRFMK